MTFEFCSCSFASNNLHKLTGPVRLKNGFHHPPWRDVPPSRSRRLRWRVAGVESPTPAADCHQPAVPSRRRRRDTRSGVPLKARGEGRGGVI
ncbi:hypothetical protein EVAR_24952_1 [Eumeta japonica]|uniref:Uncharacterized protein n=1 Tax=Eumeta variegata TaxID=151549 RepID=A0A4C1ZZH2_EUMVA|nr:hypothetical protein EVAR_24952_1 [Eumeta japonica]